MSGEVPIKLKLKYRVPRPGGSGKAGGQNSIPKRKSIWGALAASAKKRGLK